MARSRPSTVAVYWPSNIDLSPISRMLDEEIEKIAQRVADLARQSVEFKDKSGRLRKSIRVQHDDQLGWLVRAGGTRGVGHAHLVEYGHVMVTSSGITVGSVPPHSFLRSAAEQVASELGLPLKVTT